MPFFCSLSLDHLPKALLPSRLKLILLARPMLISSSLNALLILGGDVTAPGTAGWPILETPFIWLPTYGKLLVSLLLLPILPHLSASGVLRAQP